jgi:hypothetical protein
MNTLLANIARGGSQGDANLLFFSCLCATSDGGWRRVTSKPLSMSSRRVSASMTSRTSAL